MLFMNFFCALVNDAVEKLAYFVRFSVLNG